MFIKTLAAASFAASVLASGAAFAQDNTTAMDQKPWQKPAAMSDTAYDYFADSSTGMWRADEDFSTRWTAASAEDQAMLKTTCTELEKDQTLFTDTVSSRCKQITGPAGG